jgi:predicted dithiol-disulfide oxidoreductase (DUF899 family)
MTRTVDKTAAQRAVSREEWLAARKAHLKNEKALTRLRDLVTAERLALPWVKVEKRYVFDTPDGKKTLADLFGNNSQLIVYHFMWLWDVDSGCPNCSFVADHFDGANLHLAHHDVSFVAITRAPVAKFAPYHRRLGWHFPWASSYENDFNFDYHVSFTDKELATGKINYNFDVIEDPKYHNDEMPGISVFYKDGNGDVFHTYSSYARGLDIFLGAHNFLDIAPKGRNEEEIMDWVRRHDEYDNAPQQTSAA